MNTTGPNTSDSAATVRAAVWPADEPAAITLLRHYADFLLSSPAAAALSEQEYGHELATLAQRLSEPRGAFLLAMLGTEPCGCVAVSVCRDRPVPACEVKRLWVEPAGRGLGLGRQLVTAAMEWSRAHGAAMLLLDTLPAAMPEASRLYASLQFKKTARFGSTALSGLEFLALDLATS